ncbi:hypothetical protein CCY97_01995 [Helicobacter sp. 10-6591]|nr:hypothetical protein CCY97_01995 [Helicobacter sp. 10-6591]
MCMSEILYFIFVFPLEQSLDFTLQSLIKYLHSPALSIVAISILINVFLFKLFVFTDKKAHSYNDTKQKLDSRIKAWKSVYKGAKLHAFTKTLYRQNHYHPLYALIGLGGLALQIPFFIAMGLVISKSTIFENAQFLWITDLSKPDSVFGIHILPFAMTFFTLLNVFLASKQKAQRIQGIFIALVFLVLLYDMPSALVLYWSINTLVYLLKSIVTKPQESTQAHSERLQAPKMDKTIIGKTSQIYKNISMFAILNICILICVFSPFAVYSSDVSQFDPTQTKATLSALFGIFLLTSFVCIYLTSFFYNTRLLKLGTFACVVLVLIVLSYTLIFTGNIFNGRPYAPLDGLLFKDGGANISSIWAKYFDIGYCIGLCVVAFLLLYFAKNFLLIGLVGFFCIFCISSFIDIVKITYNNNNLLKNHTVKKDSQIHDNTPILPDYIDPYLSFSKEKNIVVIMSDTVQSDNFTQALKDYPEFFDMFEGFTYYPNALSVSNITFSSLPAIIGGMTYTPHNINKLNLKHTLAEENSKAIVDISNTFSNAGYAVSFGTIFPGDEKYIRPKLNKDVFLVPDNEGSAWVDFYKKKLAIKDLESADELPLGDLFSIGLFRASPYIFRSRIYVADAWIFGGTLLNTHYKYAITNASKFIAMAYLSNTNAQKPTFKFFQENTDHFPWVLDFRNSCKPIDSTALYREKMMGAKDELAYSNHLCFIKNLGMWLQWLKDSQIYDKTKIVIVSDHGNGGVGAPLIEFPRRELRNSHIFFIAKDFDTRGKLKIDRQTFVTNADAMSIACDEIGCPNIPPSFLKKPFKERELIFSLVDGGTGRQSNTSFNILLEYKVKNSVFDLENWIDITQSTPKQPQ